VIDGRPEWIRTIDLFRVKAHLFSPLNDLRYRQGSPKSLQVPRKTKALWIEKRIGEDSTVCQGHPPFHRFYPPQHSTGLASFRTVSVCHDEKRGHRRGALGV